MFVDLPKAVSLHMVLHFCSFANLTLMFLKVQKPRGYASMGIVRE